MGCYLKNASKLLAICLGCLFLCLVFFPIGKVSSRPIYTSNSLAYPVPGQDLVYLPIIAKPLIPPETPVLATITNSDGDNLYTVNWTTSANAATYVLQESTSSGFVNPISLYTGTTLSWTTPNPGKTPNTYYYRVKASNAISDSSWSSIQPITIYPLYVGLSVRYDAAGYVRVDTDYDVGYHWTNTFDILTEPDIARSNNQEWYDPNPQGWRADNWYSFYSISTGIWESSSVPGDPSWKWGYSWFRSYTFQFSKGQTVSVDGQPFLVSGPISGYTAFGKAVQYWQLINKNKILYWDGGGDWTQYCNPGDIVLRYDAGNTNLLLYDNIMRRYYYQGKLSTYTVQYIENLTFASSFPNMVAGDLANTNPISTDLQQGNDANKKNEQGNRNEHH
jgi:hypothetical protein